MRWRRQSGEGAPASGTTGAAPRSSEGGDEDERRWCRREGLRRGGGLGEVFGRRWCDAQRRGDGDGVEGVSSPIQIWIERRGTWERVGGMVRWGLGFGRPGVMGEWGRPGPVAEWAVLLGRNPVGAFISFPFFVCFCFFVGSFVLFTFSFIKYTISP